MLEILIEEAKQKILEKEREKGIKRVFAERENLFLEWKEKYQEHFAIRSNWKLYIPKLKIKVLDKKLISVASLPIRN